VTTPAVAVRSSALDEDGLAASFAGQHETVLNVSGLSAVLAAIGRCWASFVSERALAYRRQHGLTALPGRLAVLVQELVPADVAAVLFSANPISRRRDEIVITASWGLGESIVGGSVTPDTYIVRKGCLSIVSRQLGQKSQMTVAVPGGTREVVVPRLLRGRLTLSDEQAVELARLALRLEVVMSWPVDIECAYAADRLYLLQCRPVTTLDEPARTVA
jgi:pyruvate,water dikinase